MPALHKVTGKAIVLAHIHESMANNSTPSVQQLRRAIEIQEEIDRLERGLKLVLQGEDTSAETKAASIAEKPKKTQEARKKRFVSPEAREKMAAAQRRRWAKAKKK
jgi:hypothetical protein